MYIEYFFTLIFNKIKEYLYIFYFENYLLLVVDYMEILNDFITDEDDSYLLFLFKILIFKDTFEDELDDIEESLNLFLN